MFYQQSSGGAHSDNQQIKHDSKYIYSQLLFHDRFQASLLLHPNTSLLTIPIPAWDMGAFSRSSEPSLQTACQIGILFAQSDKDTIIECVTSLNKVFVWRFYSFGKIHTLEGGHIAHGDCEEVKAWVWGFSCWTCGKIFGWISGNSLRPHSL